MDVEFSVVRRFSRYFTRRTGVLADRYLGQDRPLAEARLLFEIGSGCTLRELRTRLDLDAGYLSRMTRSLDKQGLIRIRANPQDSRLRLVELTDAGQQELADQHRRVNEVVASLMHGLDEYQRAELVTTLSTAERLLRLATITVRLADPASENARHCLAAYAHELRTRFPEGFDDDDLVAASDLSGDNGAFLVAYEESRPVGCGALRTLEPGIGEIRHIWVDGQARGLGLGRRLLAELERHAAEVGHRKVRLGTHDTLTEAIAMYRSSDYHVIPRYTDDAHTHHWFEKHLT